jgi:penicillin-insensitive murein endopeptidase
MRAGALVQGSVPGSPPLGVGDLSRAQGGSIRPYSKSHQSGRDADLAFYAVTSGKPESLTDLVAFGSDLRAKTGDELMFDVRRNWVLVRGLLEDPEIDVRWLFIAPALARALIEEAQRSHASEALRSRAAATLHQPSDAPLHDNHLHVRIRCSTEERARGCED